MAPPKKLTSTGSRPPTREIGAVLQGVFSPAGMAPWTRFVDMDEYVPELQWPNSVKVYEQMRSDTQIAALYLATVLAILKFQWKLDPNGAEDAMVTKLSKDYNLPIAGEKVNTRQRAKKRFIFRHHLRKALYAGIYGHYYFEQVGNIQDDGLWHLRKLAERPPRTIMDFRVAEDGGLISIIQNISPGKFSNWGALPEIPIDNIVGYVNEQEGANWAGRSWFRECYKNWLIKDRLMRIDAINHQRAGGVPYIEAHPGATFAEVERLNEMARGFRIGDTSGGAVPAGAKFNIARGTNSSVVDSIKYHDEAMARKFMLMVMQLGQTKVGSRALGQTFVDFWGGGLEAIAQWIADTFNEHVIEDDVDWNFGEGVEQVPILIFEFDPEMVVEELVKLTTGPQAIIQVDDELENAIRKEMGLPDKGTPRKPQILTAPTPAGAPGTKSTSKAQVTAGVEDEGAPSRPEAPVVHSAQMELYMPDIEVHEGATTIEQGNTEIHMPAPNVEVILTNGERKPVSASVSRDSDGKTRVRYSYEQQRPYEPTEAIITKDHEGNNQVQYVYPDGEEE